MLTIGCHLSASDGFLAMGRTALDIGANTFQFFTRNPRGSKAKAIDPADAAALLEEGGVTVHLSEQYADAPTQTGGLTPLLLDGSSTVLLDVGGNDTGARLIGGCAHLLRTAAVYFVVNPYRPWSGTAAHIDGTLSAVLRASRLQAPRFLLNPNLGRHTTAQEYLDGLAQGLALLTPYVAVEAAAVPDALYAQVRSRTGLPLLRITPRITVPETGLDE